MMTPEEINIACADIIGLFRLAPLRRETRKGSVDPNGVVLWYCDNDHGGAKEYARLPDFYNSLDACKRFLPFIPVMSKWAYIAQKVTGTGLVGYCEGDYHDDLCKLGLMCHMNASERCEIFLKYHGRWIE